MSIAVPQDTSQPAQTATPDLSTASSLPLRARLSQWRQRIILTLRWWFRLPIDDLKDAQFHDALRAFADANRRNVEAIQQLARATQELSQRVSYYEENIPRMRDLRAHLEQERAGIRKPSSNGSRILTIDS